MDLDERFWSKVQKSDGCWLWTGARTRAAAELGYGRFWLNGRAHQAHRLSYAEHFRCDPADLFVMHSCDVRLCVNPAHLSPGTHADNMRDASRKGRTRTGSRPQETCRRGHLMEGANVRLAVMTSGKQRRICRECEQIRGRAKRAALAPAPAPESYPYNGGGNFLQREREEASRAAPAPAPESADHGPYKDRFGKDIETKW